MDKWPGRQNGRNHAAKKKKKEKKSCCKTEYRKKNEKEWRQSKRPLGQH